MQRVRRGGGSVCADDPEARVERGCVMRPGRWSGRGSGDWAGRAAVGWGSG